MDPKIRRTILLVGNDATLRYLLGRFVEESQYVLAVIPVITSVKEITELNPKAIIFLSTERLEEEQAWLTELNSLEAAIIVCSAVAEEAKAREFGADHCLLHPITYDSFQNVLEMVRVPKRA